MSETSPVVLRLAAPAKINLYLHVTGRRDDGYRLLDSLVVFAGICDRLELSAAEGLKLRADGPFAERMGPNEGNLVLRAAKALSRAAGVKCGVAARVTKIIPPAAGLGGGSADAAAMLRGLMRLWEIPADAVDLSEIALDLGADVPVCLEAAPSFVAGIGEIIDPAPLLPEFGLLLVNPGIALSTPSVFAGRRGGFSPSGRFTDSPADARALAAILGERHNDLTDAAIALAPVIGDVIAALAAAPGCHLARMSGSGATCFGIFDDEEAAAHAAGSIDGDGWWVRPTRAFGQSPDQRGLA